MQSSNNIDTRRFNNKISKKRSKSGLQIFVKLQVYVCRATTGKGCPEACQRDYKSLADFSSNFTLFLDASLIIFSPHA